MKRCIFLFFLLYCIAFNISAQNGFVEIWSHNNYAANNLGDEKNFLMNTTVIRCGFRLPLKGNSLFFDTYVGGETVLDAFYKNHPNIYENNIKFWPGLKLNFSKEHKYLYLNYLQLDLYSEYKTLVNISKETETEFNNIDNTDFVSGLKVWANSNGDEFVDFQLYGDFAWHSSNFSPPDQTSFFILSLSPFLIYNIKIAEKNIISPYLNFDMAVDFLNEEKNQNPYSNRLLNRFGVRKLLKLNNKHYLLVYSDIAKPIWFSNPYDWPLPKSDFRLGCIYYFNKGLGQPFKTGI